MRPYDVDHRDPLATARTAAIRSRAERDATLREAARRMTPAERLAEGFRLSRFAANLRDAA